TGGSRGRPVAVALHDQRPWRAGDGRRGPGGPLAPAQAGAGERALRARLCLSAQARARIGLGE
ncbi:MAG: hypothetical protein ACK55I_29090, partial [bacterium]